MMPLLQRQKRDAVIAELTRFIRRHAASPSQRRLLEICFLRLRRDCCQDEPLLFMELPLAVHAAAGGSADSAIRIAAACSLVFIGADVLDDLADGDSRPEWAGSSAGEITLAAATYLSSLAPMAIAELELPCQTKADLHITLASGLLHMASGQHDDLNTTSCIESITPKFIEQAVIGKSGQEFKMFCALAAQAAGASSEASDHYGTMGLAIGVGGQLASDCFELLEDPEARDLRHGTWTLPLAMHRSRLSEGERPAFEQLVDRARSNEDARTVLRDNIRNSGALRMTVFTVETYRQQALRELDAARPAAEARTAIHNLINTLSFFKSC